MKHRKDIKNRGLLACQSGAALLVVGLAMTLITIVFAMVIDMGRIYAAQSRAQSASDAALLGAVKGARNPNLQAEQQRVETEARRLFAANYPQDYLGTSISDYFITQAAPQMVNDVETVDYRSQLMLRVPSIIVGLFSSDFTDIPVVSVATVTTTDSVTPLELALVLDNTGSMCEPCTKIAGLKQASSDLINILFGDNATSNDITVSIIPYNVAVNIGAGRRAWIQPGSSQTRYDSFNVSGNGYVSNRNNDITPNNGFNDASSVAPNPAAVETLFRTPLRNITNYGECVDTELNYPVARMRFGMNVKADILAVINGMATNGCTRIPVGLMWGWFTLSPNWAGLFDAARPGVPAPFSAQINKSLVLMTDGKNTAFDGRNGSRIDDNTMAQICTAVKADGITLYVVGLGTGAQVNEPVLQACASPGPNRYWLAPTAEQLREAFRQIASEILSQSTRLSQ